MGNTGEFYGTNADGSKILNIATTVLIVKVYWWDDNGQMVELCVPHMVEAHPETTEEKARQMMKEFFLI